MVEYAKSLYKLRKQFKIACKSFDVSYNNPKTPKSPGSYDSPLAWGAEEDNKRENIWKEV